MKKFQFQLDRTINNDNYEFEKNLLPGGCSKLSVWKSKTSGKTPRYVVVKRLKWKYDEALFMVSLEFSMGRLVDHPSIISAFDIDITNTCLAMEYYPSTELIQYIECNRKQRQPQLKLSGIIDIQSQILDVLVHLNENGLAHLDIKHENILVQHHKAHQVCPIETDDPSVYHDEYSYKIKVIDLATVRSNEFTNQILGTPEMHTIDQQRQELYKPELVDVWCWGLILFSLLYGNHIWHLTTVEELVDTRIDYITKGLAFSFPHETKDTKVLQDDLKMLLVGTITHVEANRLSVKDLNNVFADVKNKCF
jgi:serine/threonine protein kinase